MQSSRSVTLAEALFPTIRTDSAVIGLVRTVALMAGFSGFVALCAQIQVRLPWTTVPITGQTFAVLVTGGALGAWRGAGALSIYLVAGMFLPVFTPGSAATAGGWDAHLILPWSGNEYFIWNAANGGYIVGFILAAAIVGFLAERGWDRKQWVQVGMLVGNVALYVPGLLWLGYLIGTDWTPPGASAPLSELIVGSDTLDKTLKGGLYPFIVGDMMKLMLASMALPTAWLLAAILIIAIVEVIAAQFTGVPPLRVPDLTPTPAARLISDVTAASRFLLTYAGQPPVPMQPVGCL